MTSPAASTSYVQPFLPSKDFELSKAFYEAVGFRKRFEAPDICGYDHSSGSFLLTPYYSPDLDGHLMMAWSVDDLEAWFTEVSAADLPGRFGVPPVKPPTLQPWGLVIAYMIDPSGILWHVSQKPAA